MQLTILASLALLAIGVSAGEGVHLANCLQSSSLGDIPSSRMLYYADDKQANLNVTPSSNNQCSVTGAGGGPWKTWEGSTISCAFPTNTYFASTIQSGAGSYSVGQWAGTGQNNYHGWNCYRDNEHQLFNDGTHRCWSVYYCLGV